VLTDSSKPLASVYVVNRRICWPSWALAMVSSVPVPMVDQAVPLAEVCQVCEKVPLPSGSGVAMAALRVLPTAGVPETEKLAWPLLTY